LGRSPRYVHQPGYRPTCGQAYGLPISHSAAGKRLERLCLGLFDMSTPCTALRAFRISRAIFLLAFLGLGPLAASAQSQLDSVIVTGTREPQALSQSAADMVLISSETVRNTSATTVEELLRHEAGIQLAQNGGPGQSSGYFIRGAETSGTVVLIDGVRVGSATLGQAEFESLSLSQVDHIEVLRGPASSLYGADAVGGVIQIFTRRGDGAMRVTGGAAIGGYNSKQGDIGVSGSQGAFDYAASLGRQSSRGVSEIRPNDQFGDYNPDRDGYRRDTENFRLGYSPAAGHHIGVNYVESHLNSQYDSADFLPPDFAADPSADFRNHLRTEVASIDYRGEISSLWTTTVQLARNLDDSLTGGQVLSRFRTDREQLTWQNALHLAPGQQVVLAYEYLHEKEQATGFADDFSRNNNAFVAGYSGQFGANHLEASLRNDANSVYGNNTTGSLGYSYELIPGLKLRALAGTTFRAPTFNDLYFPDFGVPTIKPERGRSVEVGTEWRSGDTSASATVYQNKVKDLIGFDPDPNGTDCPVGDFGCAANTDHATLRGATLTGAQGWGGFTLRGTVDFLSAKDDDTGERLARRAAHQETLAANYARGSWTAGASILDVGSRPDGGIVLGGYSVVDLRATWRFMPQWRLEAKLLNALDHRIEPVRDYQGLGRQAWIGIRYDGLGL
jgi:vitamin B12 transporter